MRAFTSPSEVSWVIEPDSITVFVYRSRTVGCAATT